MAKGYMGDGGPRVLFVDLSSGRADGEQLGEDYGRRFLGGYGLGAALLFDRQRAGADALGPENHLGFFPGLLTGTGALVASRFMVVGRSPLTGTWGDSNAGGYFGPALKAAGLDGVLCRGTADRPVYLLVEDGTATVHDAADLAGRDTYETDDILRARHGKSAHVACIGPAGERRALIAGISTDKGRFAARSGLGAVMGAKGLKAVVARGDRPVPVADPGRLEALRKAYFPRDEEFTKYGTAKEPANYTESGEAPVKNWGASGRAFPTAWKITGDQIIRYQKRKYTCSRCPIRCGAIMEVEDGPFATLGETHKPQYETLGALGILCLIDDPAAMIRFNEICNRSGLDTISTGAAIAFAIECRQNGVLRAADCDGLDLAWGDATTALALAERMGRREGLGDLLADGVRAAARRIGSGAERFAIHVAGQEPSMHDPKNTNGLALTYLLDATPGRHSAGGELLTPPGFEVPRVPKGVYTGRAKAHQDLVGIYHVSNAAGNCMLAYFFVSASSIPEFIAAVSGWDFDMAEALVTGERIHTIRHAFNLREGYNPLDNLERVSPRIFGAEPLPDGPNRGISIDTRVMVGEYLAHVDWDPVTTVPSRRRLAMLGLDAVGAILHGD